MVILFHQTLMRNASVRTERFCRSFVTTGKSGEFGKNSRGLF